MSNRRLVPLNVLSVPNIPAGAAQSGDIIYVTADSNLYVSDGENWTSIGGASGPYGQLQFDQDFAEKTTDDLTEGLSNLYFTDQRALDATSTAYDPAGAATQAEVAANLYTDQSVAAFDPLPTQTGNDGKFLQTDGSTTSWAEVPTTASQFVVFSAEPSSPSMGAVYFDSTLLALRVYDGFQWLTVVETTSLDAASTSTSTADGGTAASTPTAVLDGGTA